MAAPALSLKNIGMQFGNLKAIDSISLNVEPGGRHAVLGANGAGKTTLFNTITGDLIPTSGRIEMFGHDITQLSPHSRVRQGLRRTYQNSQLFDQLDVKSNILIAARGVRSGRYSLRGIQAQDDAVVETNALMDKLKLGALADTLAVSLSHGQQRQVEVAMALVGQPTVLLLDEPAAGLSPVERAELTQLLLQLPKDMALVIVEHDLEIALRVAHTVTVMHNGQLLAEGTPKDIENNALVQSVYLGTYSSETDDIQNAGH